MVLYRHTQIGKVLLAGLMTVLLVSLSVSMADFHPIAIVFVAFLVILTLLFHSLTVEVGPEELTVRFGIGLIRKRIPLQTIESAKEVRNRWYYGYGIRLTPHGWLWNVSGLEAVELTLSQGKRFRIGTDEPRELLRALASIGRVTIAD